MRLIDADVLKSYIDLSEKKSIPVIAVKGCINNMPTVDAVPVVHGKWRLVDKKDGFPDWICSVCGSSGRGDYMYCPWCNARMDGNG